MRPISCSLSVLPVLPVLPVHLRGFHFMTRVPISKSRALKFEIAQDLESRAPLWSYHVIAFPSASLLPSWQSSVNKADHYKVSSPSPKYPVLFPLNTNFKHQHLHMCVVAGAHIQCQKIPKQNKYFGNSFWKRTISSCKILCYQCILC